MKKILLIGLLLMNLINTRLLGDNFKQIFSQKSNCGLYWESIIALLDNNMDRALKLAHEIQSDAKSENNFLEIESRAQNIDSFFDKLFISHLSNNPQLLTKLGLFELLGIKEHNQYLNDISIQAILSKLEEKKENLRLLESYQLDTLSPEQKLSHAIFSWKLKHAIDGEKFLFHKYRVHQMGGLLSDLLAIFTQFHKIENSEDVKNFIIRLTKIPAQLQQITEFIELQKSKRILLPKFALERVISSIKTVIPENTTDNIIYKYLEKNLEEIKIDNKHIFLDQAIKILNSEVSPAYKNLINYLQTLLETVNNNNGVWALPDGDKYYEYTLKHHTTTDLSPNEIHEIGLQEVQNLEKIIRKVFTEEFMVDENKSLGTLLQEFSKNPSFYYPNTDNGRKECLADYEIILENSRQKLKSLFDLSPRTPVKIQAAPKFEEEGRSAAYYFQPSLDGSRPGTFFVNLKNMENSPKYNMETLTIHEAEPGHHFQIALQFQMPIPKLRKIYLPNAFIEGWALYVERLAFEENFHSSPSSKLGYLQFELLRATRLVIDTGIHYKRWSKEQAIEYMIKTTGYSRQWAKTEVERYFVMPGQACSYKIGQLKILELREMAKKKLGKDFDIKIFHNNILKTGAVPLTILEDVISKY